MNESHTLVTNIRVRTNVVSFDRFLEDPDRFCQSLTWPELHQHLALFWQLRNVEIMQTLTGAQRAERENLLNRRLSLPDPYNSVCLAHQFLLPPFSTQQAESEGVTEVVAGGRSANGTEVIDASAPPQIENLQERIIHAPPRARQLVLAPPGTGKTHTAIQRLVRLHQSDRLGGDLTQVLMVSFSRSAAAELGYRLGETLRERKVSIHTFPRLSTLDSLAGQLLFRDMGIEADTGGYDGSIRLLASILEGHRGKQLQEDAQELIRTRISVVVVDEVQDVVGVRANLVLAILRALRPVDPGILILGDLRQAIYGFALEKQQGDEREMTPFQLIRDIQSEFPDLERIEFTRQHRFSPGCQQLMTRLREAMDADARYLPGECPDRDRLRDLLREVPELDDPYQLFGDELAGQRVAVLARTNREVSQLAVGCREPAEIHARVLRVAGDPEGGGFPAWVGRVLGDEPTSGSISETAFLDLYRRRVLNDVEQARRHLDWLAHACRLDTRSFRIRDVLDWIEQDSRIPTDLRESAKVGEIWLSTIHQAKGREFEVVVVADPLRLLERATDDPSEEARVLYVALTRARSQVFRCRGPQWLPPTFRPPASALDFSEESCAILVSSAFQNALWDCRQEGMRRAFVVPSEKDGYRLEVEVDCRVPGPRVTAGFLDAVSEQAGVSSRDLELTKPSFRVEIGELRSKVVGKLEDRKLVLIPGFSGVLPVRS